MDSFPIWRYLTLAKYVDLLRTRSLYFPKASLFQDDAEGKWFGHAFMFEQSQRWTRAADNARKLEALLKAAGDDPDRMLQQANRVIALENKDIDAVLLSVLRDVGRVFRHKRREYLEDMILSWQKHYNNHNQEVQQWISELGILRESTYISCWNRASTMSLAMWDLYGGES